MINQLTSKALLDPLVFQWLATYKPWASRIFWNQYNLRYAGLPTFEAFVPAQTIHQFTPPSCHVILVVGVDPVDIPIEATKDPLRLKAFTGRNGSWTMSRSNPHRFETVQNIPNDVRRRSREATEFDITTKFKFHFGGNEVGDYSLLRCLRVWNLELVEHEEKLTKMLYSVWISVLQETTIHIKDSPKVRLQQCRYTSTLVSSFELTWHLEAKFYQTQVQGFPQEGESFG
jgi:hypothetical protein